MNKDTIIFLHGFMGQGADWQFYIRGFSGRYACFAPNLHDNLKQMSISGMCRQLNNQIKDPAIIVGYSMGGRVALNFTEEFPLKVKKLVLISANPGIEDEAERNSRIVADELLAKKIENEDFSEFLDNWYKNPIFTGMSENLKSAIITKKMQNDPKILADSLRIAGTGRMKPLWKGLNGIQVPVLVISGKRDEKYTKISSMISRLIKNCDSEIIPEAAHCVHLEKPEIVFDIIKEFIER